MKLRRIVPALLSAAVLLSAFAGCAQVPADSPPPETPAESPAEPTPGIDYDGAYAAFAPETVMITAGDYQVTWEELFFFIRSNISALESSIGEVTDWSQMLYEGQTYAQIILDYAAENALMYKALEYGAAELGTTLSDEDKEIIGSQYTQTIAEYESEEEFLDMIKAESGISSKQLYDYLVGVSYLAGLCMRDMYGEGGSALSDADVAEYTAGDGYLMAKHILRLKDEEAEEGGETPEPAEPEGDPYEEIEEILAKLDAYNGDDFDAYFDELMFEFSEDAGGLQSYPGGYLFQFGDMVPEFSETCEALEIGDYSGIIETSYGYHIVYRLPVDYDMTPFSYYMQYDFSTLRYIAAMGLFDATLYGWIDSLEEVYSDEYTLMDFAGIFKIHAAPEAPAETTEAPEESPEASGGQSETTSP